MTLVTSEIAYEKAILQPGQSHDIIFFYLLRLYVQMSKVPCVWATRKALMRSGLTYCYHGSGCSSILSDGSFF